jgi:hypothetical protein
MPLAPSVSSQSSRAADRSHTVVTPLCINSHNATSVAALRPSGSASNNGRYSYSELMYSWRLPTSSVRPFSIGSEDGCAWMSTKPGKTAKPRPSISIASAESAGPAGPIAAIVSPSIVKSTSRR